jgi:hypothetical protein
MSKRRASDGPATMIIPRGTDIRVDVHGQLSIRTPGSLVLENSGSFGVLESLNGSIRIEPQAEVEAVEVQCAEVCYVQGSLTAWRVAARSLRLESQARASIVLQETQELEIGRGARLVGNFEDDKELFVLFSRFADQLRSLPLFATGESHRVEATDSHATEKLLEAESELSAASPPEAMGASSSKDENLADPLFFALILLEREFARSAYGPTSQRVIEELIELLKSGDRQTLATRYEGLCGRIVEPGPDIRRAFDLLQGYFQS